MGNWNWQDGDTGASAGDTQEHSRLGHQERQRRRWQVRTHSLRRSVKRSTFYASPCMTIITLFQFNKIHNPMLLLNNGTSVSPAVSARNLGIIFHSHLTFEDQLSSVSRACFYHIRDLRGIRSVINFNRPTAKTIGTSFVHSRLDFCNSL